MCKKKLCKKCGIEINKEKNNAYIATYSKCFVSICKECYRERNKKYQKSIKNVSYLISIEEKRKNKRLEDGRAYIEALENNIR